MFQDKLDQANERIEKLSTKILKDERKLTDPSEEPQRTVESLREQLRKKEEECSLLQKELSAANSAKSSLETGKVKAKVEIHGLLRRVQESERWMKCIKRTLERVGIPSSKESFSETWEKLEALLRTVATSKPSPRPVSSSQPSTGFPSPLDPNSLKGNSTDPVLQKSMSPSHIFQRTEFIYRTQSITSGAYSSPGRQSPAQAVAVEKTSKPAPKTQGTKDIVPFRDMYKRLPSKKTCSQNEDLETLTEILWSTSANREPCTLTDGMQCPDPDSTGTEPLTEGAAGSKDELTKTRQKMVTFQAPNANTGVDHGGTPKRSDGRKFRTHTPLETRGARARHQIKRTYSRHEYRSALDEGDHRVIAESPCNRNTKRARVSAASCSKSRETPSASEYFDQRTSPASSDSTNRLPTTGNYSSQKRIVRGQRRGRKSRGKIVNYF